MNLRRTLLVIAVLFVPLALSAVGRQDCRFTIVNKTDTTLFINVDGTEESIFGYKDGRNVCDMKPGGTCAFVESLSCHTLHAMVDMTYGAIDVATKKISDCGLDGYTWTINQADIR